MTLEVCRTAGCVYWVFVSAYLEISTTSSGQTLEYLFYDLWSLVRKENVICNYLVLFMSKTINTK